MHPSSTSTSLPCALVVDDDPDLCELLSVYLGSNGYTVVCVHEGAQMRATLSAGCVPDVVVMDLMLPGDDGLALTRWLKSQHPDWPILMLSAKGEEMDRVIGLEVGADDYLPKPFGPRELLARLRALQRRHSTALPSSFSVGERVVFGPYVLELAGRRLLNHGTEVELTTAEFDLLAVMAQRPNRVLSRDMLVELLKGFDRDAFDRSMDNRVTRLRRKLEHDPARPVYIRTVRGEGYLFNPRGDQT